MQAVSSVLAGKGIWPLSGMSVLPADDCHIAAISRTLLSGTRLALAAILVEVFPAVMQGAPLGVGAPAAGRRFLEKSTMLLEQIALHLCNHPLREGLT